MIVEIFATTDNGQRSGQNEDNFAVCKDISSKSWVFKPNEKVALSEQGAVMLVADGMGGANAGEVASDIAQKVVQAQFNRLEEVPASDKLRASFLKNVIQNAHDEIVRHQVDNLGTAGMGTTLVILWAVPDKAYVAWCGDSRLYIFRKGVPLKPATDDHSYVWELVKQGKLTAEEARLHPESNIITQSLGDPGTPPKPEVKTFELFKDDRFLLCSDGLNSMLDDEHIEAILKQEDDTVEACKNLIAEANAAGGRDNITVVLLDVREGQPASAAAGAAVTNTQELRGNIKTKNKVITILSILLLCIVGYIIVAYAIPHQSDKKSERGSEEKDVAAEASPLNYAGPNPESALTEPIPLPEEQVSTEVVTETTPTVPKVKAKVIEEKKTEKDDDSLATNKAVIPTDTPVDSTTSEF